MQSDPEAAFSRDTSERGQGNPYGWKTDRPQYTALYECVSGNLFFHPAGFHPFDQCG